MGRRVLLTRVWRGFCLHHTISVGHLLYLVFGVYQMCIWAGLGDGLAAYSFAKVKRRYLWCRMRLCIAMLFW
jgi:hypothetical protein